MRRKLVGLGLLMVMAAFAGPASALTISGGVQVGIVDSKRGESPLLSGEDTELQWVKGILGPDVTFILKNDNLTESDWTETSQSGTWAFNLRETPDYFLVKTGNNHTNAFMEYLFANNDSKTWAVLDLDDVYVTRVTNIGIVSHVNEYDSADPVPEPGTMMLLGAGFLGLAVYNKRRKNA